MAKKPEPPEWNLVGERMTPTIEAWKIKLAKKRAGPEVIP
jgi:hypothetical protein